MLLEVKSHGKTEMKVHAKNVYNLCDSVFRLASNKTVEVELWGRLEKRTIKYMGWHLLVLSNTRPDNSEWMLWDHKYNINEGHLVKILRFESSPHTLPSQKLFFKEAIGPTEATATTAHLEAGSELEQLRMNWGQILDEAPADIKRTNAIALLRSAGVQPVEIEDNTIVLAFRYELHRVQMEKTENQEIAEKIIGDFLGHSCHIRCIDEQAEIQVGE